MYNVRSIFVYSSYRLRIVFVGSTELHLVATPKSIADITNGTAIGVSDGSFKDQFGTASWVIENARGTQRITGNVLIPGHHTDHSAYRSEIGGLYGLVLMTELMKEVWGVSGGGITLGCDGLGALYQSVDVKYFITSCKQQHFDLISGIQGYIRPSAITYTPKHIKGHQDDIIDISKLDRWAILNIEMDFRAKDYWQQMISNQHYFDFRTNKGLWTINICGKRICTYLAAFLRESIDGEAVADYWVHKRKRFSEKGFINVD